MNMPDQPATPMGGPFITEGGQLEYCGIGRRFGALVIDSVVLGIIYGIFVAMAGNADASGSSVSVSLTGLPAFLYFVVVVFYYVILESRGATLGKAALGMRVAKLDGTSISMGQAFGRNALRVIDSLPCLYILGAILIATSDKKQRLGDRAAGTVVVRA